MEPTVPRILDTAHVLSTWRRDGITRPSLLLHGANVPTVDIFIPCCGEGLDLVLDTVRATCALDYPVDRFRVIVLDDSASEALASVLTTEFQTFKNVYYTTRKKFISTHSKAGNLNWGLSFVASLPGGSSEFVAVLDTDMIPTPNWLRRLMPHLLQNPNAAMVTPPQNYYNTPLDDRYDEGVYFIRLHDVVTVLLDRSGEAMCTGTGFIARRKAIDAIGGFPTQSQAESVLTSWKLKATSWQSIYVSERVQWGLGPQTLQSYIKQCKKLAIAVVSLMEHTVRPSQNEQSAVSRIMAPKLILLLYTMPYWTSTLNMILVPCLLLFGGFGKRSSGPPYFTKSALVLALIDFVSQCLYGFTISALGQHRLYILHHLSSLWIAPHQLSALLGTLNQFARSSSVSGQPYAPTNKVQPNNDATKRQIDWALLKNVSLGHGIMLLICVAGASLWIFQSLQGNSYQNTTALWSNLIFSIGWPPFFLIWTAYVANAWIPVSCFLFPPVRPSRKKLLVLDQDTGVRYPSQDAKANWYRKKRGWHFYLMIVYYISVSIAVLAGGI